MLVPPAAPLRNVSYPTTPTLSIDGLQESAFWADVGGVPEYVAHGQGGALTPAGDADALARTIVEWLDAAPRRREAAAFNRQRAVQQFSWRASAAKLLAVYESVLAARQTQVPA